MEIGNIKNPSFLKKMSVFELEELSRNIRNFLIDKISITGGHLSSNLGIVDLTIAIHKVFNAPKDKVIFDVGHQSYTHKILTGRAHEFDKLRQYDCKAIEPYLFAKDRLDEIISNKEQVIKDLNKYKPSGYKAKIELLEDIFKNE